MDLISKRNNWNHFKVCLVFSDWWVSSFGFVSHLLLFVSLSFLLWGHRIFMSAVLQSFPYHHGDFFLSSQVLGDGRQGWFHFVIVLMKQRSDNIGVHDMRAIGRDRSHAPGEEEKFQQVIHGQPHKENLQHYFKNIDYTVHNPVHQPMFFLLAMKIF